jgi:hypothetical protein
MSKTSISIGFHNKGDYLEPIEHYLRTYKPIEWMFLEQYVEGIPVNKYKTIKILISESDTGFHLYNVINPLGSIRDVSRAWLIYPEPISPEGTIIQEINKVPPVLCDPLYKIGNGRKYIRVKFTILDHISSQAGENDDSE